MAPKTNFHLDPRQQENWEENIPHLLSLTKTVRILQILMVVLFCLSVYRGKIHSLWQILAFCAALLLSVLFSELFRNNLRKNRSPYLPSLYILGIICCIGNPILIIVNRLPDSLDWDIYTALSLIFGGLSIIPTVYFLFDYRRNKLAPKIIRTAVSIVILIQILTLLPIALFDVYCSYISILISVVNLLELSLIASRNKKMKHNRRD